MRIFISYSHHDAEIVQRIIQRLRQDEHIIWLDTLKLEPGDNIQDKVEAGLQAADAVIVIISESSFRSKWVQQEVAAVALQTISTHERLVIPVRIDKSQVPSYLLTRVYVDLSEDFEHGLDVLSTVLRRLEAKTLPDPGADKANKIDHRAAQLHALTEALHRGRLSLFCGAGISVGAGIPVWNDLLLMLLERMMEKIADDHSLDLGKRAAKEFQNRNGSSSLILGKYLKNVLGNDFTEKVRNVLYALNPQNSDIIDSIVALSRPQRDGRPLDSIVTFNFDCLIEENLAKASIPNKPIFSDSMGHAAHMLPVYHVHGYLPRTGVIPGESQLVFSEDAYHTQFIDPFSWSNLIQLTKLTQNVCLLVGISLTDPNMRRLLDVAWRKNTDKKLSHFMIKKVPNASGGDIIDDVTKLLEEQDANALGLNVIWVREYDEIPIILLQIADSH